MQNALSDSLLQQETVERHFASARKAAKIGLFDYSVEHDLIYWSDELFEMTGLDPEEFPAVSAQLRQRIDPEDLPEFEARFTRALEQGEGTIMTVRFHRPDRTIVRIEIIAELRETVAGRRMVGIARDVTSELTAAEKLMRQEERFRIIADTLSDVLWDFDLESRTFWATPNWPSKLGLAIDPAAFDPMKWSSVIIEEDRKEAEAALADAIMLGSSRWQSTFRVREPDGRLEHIEIKAAILRREEGGVHRILGNVRNVTLEKQALEGSSRSRALEAVGQMTGGVAHDFNNLLMIIQGNAELLAMSELNEDDQESVELIGKASRSAAELTNRLLAFSGQTRLNTARVEVHEAIAQIGPLLKSGLTESVRLMTHVSEDCWDIEVDQNELEQAIINLAVNARDAMPAGGTVEVRCDNRVITDAQAGADLGLKAGRYVCISVIDDGVGMSEEVIARAFDPFFTTKEFGRGTGLGLSSVYGFAQQSGGTIEIDSEPGRGTRVSILLPVSEGLTAPSEARPDAHAAPVPQGARILVVEDQEEVRRHVVKLLTRAGFVVECAQDASSALELLSSDARFDLMFTDIIMPGGVNGVELCEKARALLPDLRVLFTSGFPASALDHLKAADHEKVQLLNKPYRGSDLIAMVSGILRAG
jgi:PAS domain S-box-containing protein